MEDTVRLLNIQSTYDGYEKCHNNTNDLVHEFTLLRNKPRQAQIQMSY